MSKIIRNVSFNSDEWTQLNDAKKLFEDINNLEVSLHSFMKSAIMNESKKLLKNNKQTKLL